MSKPGWWLLLLVYATNGLPASATVMAGDREWLQPANLLGFSWTDFDAVCPGGRCAGALGGSGPDITGWNWAAIDEVGALFSMFSPHEGGISRYFAPDPAEGFDIIGRSRVRGNLGSGVGNQLWHIGRGRLFVHAFAHSGLGLLGCNAGRVVSRFFSRYHY